MAANTRAKSRRRLNPRLQAWPPAPYVVAIVFVIPVELRTQSWLFVEKDEEMDSQCCHGDRCNQRHGSAPENDPKADPSCGKPDIHRIADVAIEAHNN